MRNKWQFTQKKILTEIISQLVFPYTVTYFSRSLRQTVGVSCYIETIK